METVRQGADGRGQGADRTSRMRVTPLRVAGAVAIVLLLVGGVLAGRVWLESGCGRGERGVLEQAAPLGGAPVTFAEDALKDTCGATYTTTAPPAEVLNHHGAQLAAAGWAVEGPFLGPEWDPPHLSAGRGDFTVNINIVSQGGEDMVQLLAAHHG